MMFKRDVLKAIHNFSDLKSLANNVIMPKLGPFFLLIRKYPRSNCVLIGLLTLTHLVERINVIFGVDTFMCPLFQT